MNYFPSIADADAQYARELGRDNTQRAWILSDRDVWYRNPFYTGPAVPHPEDDYPEEDFPETVPGDALAAPPADPGKIDTWDCDIPF